MNNKQKYIDSFYYYYFQQNVFSSEILTGFVPDWSYDNDGSFAEYSDNEDGFADDNIKLPRGRRQLLTCSCID